MADETPNLQQDKFYEFKPFRVPKYQIKFEKAGKLSDIQGYTWYTPAALYLWGKFSEVNLSDIVQQDDIKVFWYRFAKPLFKNFHVGSDVGWNHTLWAAKEGDWKKIVDRVLESVQFDIATKSIYQYALQSVEICDPLFADAQGILPASFPTVNIYAFAVLSNKGQYAFDAKHKSFVPGMVTFRPHKLHVNAAQKLFQDDRLTQEKAFERVKAVLLDEQDSEYKERADRDGVRR